MCRSDGPVTVYRLRTVLHRTGPESVRLGDVHAFTKALETRATAATAGPWTYEGSGCIHTRATEHYDPEDEAYVLEVLRGPDDPSRHTANGRFVAAARTDVPALVAEVRRLRTEVERLQRTAQEGGR